MTNQKTKKCPFCAEEILSEAIVCKHCNHNLDKEDSQAGNKTGIVILIIIGLMFVKIFKPELLFILLPLIMISYIWGISKISDNKKKFVYSGVTISIFFFIWAGAGIIEMQKNRAPEIIIFEPMNDQSVQADSILIKGSVAPKHAILTVNNQKITNRDKDGDFIFEAKLNNEENIFSISARNSNQTDIEELIINRIFTEEELAEIQRLKEEAEARRQTEIEAERKAKEERLAKEKAEQAVWEASEAGKICKKHPEWTKEDCIKLVDDKIWIGMSIFMLIELRGLPDSANPSNYGSGTDWQWCWHDYNPSCFYDNNEDGLIESYN